jgi:hypothetical protein
VSGFRFTITCRQCEADLDVETNTTMVPGAIDRATLVCPECAGRYIVTVTMRKELRHAA